MRNIGASIGISTMSYLLVRDTAITQSALVEHITPYRQVVRDYAHQLNIATLSGRAALAQTVTARRKPSPSSTVFS
jgi:MFS transporter, DHA2 family, multidrug resistance protein